MLEINNVSKNFGSLRALDEVNLSIQNGEFFGLLGPNGAGKSTLMNIINGYLKADSGTVVFNGKDTGYENMAARKKMGFVTQEISLFQELSAESNLKILGGLYNLPKKELKNRINEALELVKLWDRRGDKVKEFSGGMKRRLNLAASLLNVPELLLCDEPTVGVDPQSRIAIFEMLKELNKRGITIVYTTHYMEEAEKLCSRMAIIDNGKIIAKGDFSELLENLPQEGSVRIDKKRVNGIEKENITKLGKVIDKEFAYELFPNDAALPLSNLFGKLENMNIPRQAIELKRASLEDVFIHLTGRSLRD